MQRLRVVTFSLAAFLLGGCDQPRNETSLSPIVTTNTTPAPAHAQTNRLAREKSPYLLQHQYNPVDWYPWGEEAFAKARRENKPIFLSIGYSTCHWCHVMERESFEDETVARFLNEHFVSIKVDREERPDVDKIYMTFVQATTGSGGWPLNVFLTPDLKPFFGGTYWPPETRQGRGSFMQVLQQIVKVWSERHGEIAASADEMHARLKAFVASTTATNLILTAEEVRQAGALFKDAYDPKNGGFGSAPKFPQPSQPLFLLRYAKRFADDEATQMVLHTCDKMAAGGIRDQLGGGFARYSVDAQWLVPHFEKMLYDNAQLVQLYLDAYLVSGEVRHADVVRDILDYVLRDMTHPKGGFYSAEDADSEGHEGKFYCWTYDELSKLLSPEEFNVAVSYFGIKKEGNFVDHSHPSPLPGQNVLSVVKPLTRPRPVRYTDQERMGSTSTNTSHGKATLSPSDGERDGVRGTPDDTALLASAKKRMIQARNQRVRPHLDDKVLASWNGLMLGAFARAGVVLNEPKYLAAAEKNLAFIHKNLWDAQSKSLFHRWRDGQRDNVELLNGYACMLDGVIHLYEATLNPDHLEFAIALADAMIAKFYDTEDGGFWQSTASATDLIVRSKEDYDGAEPSGNSVATLALLKLAAITDRDGLRKAAEATLRWSAARLQKSPQAAPYMLHALDFWLQEPHRVVIAGTPDAARSQALVRAAHSVYQPNKVVLGNTGPVEKFAKTLPEKNGPVVYLCTGTECKAPTGEPNRVRELLR